MKKSIALILALFLTVVGAVKTTSAWLTDQTKEVKNIFSISDVDVTLQETKDHFKMIPGWIIEKDPVAWVSADSEDCYLFIKVEKAGGNVTYTPASQAGPDTAVWDDFLAYEIAEGWNPLENAENVYYRVFNSNDGSNFNTKGKAYSILKDDQVRVKDTVTKEMMRSITKATQPTLTFTAYAVQLYKSNDKTFDPYDAWATVSSNQ